MIYDCFGFFNELDLMEIRLNVLKDVVEKFVLVEAGETHSRKTKPLYFKENAARFAEFRDRIVYVGIERFPDVCVTDWARENYQRNAIADGLKGAKDDDVLVSDLDEIPIVCPYPSHVGCRVRPGAQCAALHNRDLACAERRMLRAGMSCVEIV